MAKKNSLVAVWDFRANEDYFTSDLLLSKLPILGKKFAFQLEKGDATGYVHWQGRISLWKKKRESELKVLWRKVFEGCGPADKLLPNYLKPTTEDVYQKGDMFYQLKIDTRLNGPWTDKDAPKYIRKRFRNAELKNWQDQILKTSSTNGLNDREVNVVVCAHGNIGKSFLADYCTDHKLAYEIPAIVNDGKEILQAVTGILMGSEEREPGLMFLDLPRAMNQERLAGVMTALETIKRGKVFDFRYQYKEWLFEPPAIWVFTNIVPDRSWLSADRWKFWQVKDDMLHTYAPPPKEDKPKKRRKTLALGLP